MKMIAACVVACVVLNGVAMAEEKATSRPTTAVATRPVSDVIRSPRKSWRVVPLAASAEVSADLRAGRDASLKVSGKGEAAFAVQLPETKNVVLLTLEPGSPVTQIVATLSMNSIDGAKGTWRTLAEIVHDRASANSLEKVEIPAGPARWVRVTVRATDAKATEMQITDIGLYEIDPAGANDYWLSVGASIQYQSLRSGVFKKIVRENFGYDPILFNRAVSGWTTQDLRKALPTILKDHPQARYVTIHIGGNNISQNRPYPKGADVLRDDLIAILQMIRDAGKVPLLCTISYRAYQGDRPVPPEENGSGPYVVNVYEPVIREHCPQMIDPKTNRPRVDAYAWFKSHTDELSPDGVHVNSRGEFSWNRLWADGAGALIYGKKS